MNVYKIIGKSIPAYLKEPIVILEKGKPRREPVLSFTPNINGYIDSFYEWEMAGHYDVNEKGSTMFGRESIVKAFYYGYDEEHLYVRIDANVPACDKEAERIKIIFKILKPACARILMPLAKNGSGSMVFVDEKDKETGRKEFTGYAFNDIMEAAIPFRDLKIGGGREINFVILVDVDGVMAESWPRNRFISVNIPDKKQIMEEWSV